MYADYAFDPDDEHAKVAYYMQLLHQVLPRRVNFDNQWEEGFALVLPEWRNTLSFGHTNSPGQKRTQYQVDSAGQIALWRFSAIVDSILTPHGYNWAHIQADDPYVMKQKGVTEWFSDTSNVLWRMRYDEEANFIGEMQRSYLQLGAAGNMPLRVDIDIARKGIIYQSLGVGEIYVLQNAQGMVDGFIRYFKRDARQAYQLWGEKIPPILQRAMEQQSKTLYSFLEIVHPRTDWMPWRTLSNRGKKYTQCYLSIEGNCILEEGGYRTFPVPYGRYMVAPEEDYGRGPVQMVLPALKSKNSIKIDYLTQSHKAADPSLLIGDDGLIDIKSHAGAYNWGGWSADGKMVVGAMPTGDIKASEELMNREDQYIDAAFLVDLFKLLYQDAAKGAPQWSARQTVEYSAERGVFLSPIVAKNSLFLGKIIDRELDLASYLGKLQPMPPALREAKGEYKVRYDNPGQRAMRDAEDAGTMQTLEVMYEWANVTGDKTIMDQIDEDEVFGQNGIGANRGMPSRYFASAEKKAQKAQSRQQAQEREQQAKELPGKAAMAKAQAIVTKAQTGGNIGGALSGTPSGGMPQMPGSPGMPGMPGVGGSPGRPGQPGTPGGY